MDGVTQHIDGVMQYVCNIQPNLASVGTIGTQLAVLYREVSITQRQICTQIYVCVWDCRQCPH